MPSHKHSASVLISLALIGSFVFPAPVVLAHSSPNDLSQTASLLDSLKKIVESLAQKITVLIQPAQAQPQDLTTGLVTHWKFDEGSGTTASDSAGINHGTLTNDPTWTTAARSVASLTWKAPMTM
jgi:hypothetical protein